MIVFNLMPHREAENIAITQHGEFDFRIVYQVIEQQLTEAQRAEYNQYCLELEASPFADDEDPHEPRFTCFDDALEYAEADRDMQGIYDELHAYNAPGECYELAYKVPQQRYDAALAKSVNL